MSAQTTGHFRVTPEPDSENGRRLERVESITPEADSLLPRSIRSREISLASLDGESQNRDRGTRQQERANRAEAKPAQNEKRGHQGNESAARLR